MSVQELVQLYAPLAGMLAMAFWLGVLSERVRAIQERLLKVESHDTVADAPVVVRLAGDVEGMGKTQTRFARDLENLQRQIVSAMSGKAGKFLKIEEVATGD